MTDASALCERLEAACHGHPHAKIPWPHRILHEAAECIESQAQRNAELEEALRKRDAVMAHIGGCGDGNCVIVRPIGQHTNGGCRCARNLAPHMVNRALSANQIFADKARAALAGNDETP